MIRCVDGETLAVLRTFCARDAFGCKISALAHAYGTQTPFACFWLQTNGQGRVVSALARLEDTVILCASPDADFEELGSFLGVLGARTLQCGGEPAGFLQNRPAQRGVVMRLVDELTKPAPPYEHNPHLTEVYSLLDAAREPAFQPPPFKQFYVDMSHRVRHGAARCVGIRQEGALASCAMTVAETADAAIIGAVATSPGQRNQGFGGMVVRALARELWAEGKTIYLFRQQGKLRRFYENLGFCVCGSWREIALT